jgi:hypothetical protein
MNKIITTSISDPLIQQPFTGRSLDFIQDSTKELTTLALARALVGEYYDSSKAYIIRGLIGTGNTYSEGWILWNDELYYSPGKSTATAFVNVPVMTLTVTNDAIADPITFTDGVPRNVHNVRRMVLSDAVSGTGTFDLSNAIYLNDPISFVPTLKAYTTADVLVVGGVTDASRSAFYKRTPDGYKFYYTCYDLSTTATTAKIVIDLPFTLPTVVGLPTYAIGVSECSFYKTGVGSINCFAQINLSSGGSGTPLTIEKHDRTAFGILANYDKVFFCMDIFLDR